MEFIDLKRQYQIHREALNRAAVEVLQSGRYINGPQVAELEEALAGFAGVKQAIGVGSGTDALMVALLALGLRSGDEVICPSFTFIAAAEIVAVLGGRPVFVDVEPATGMIEPAAVEAAVTSRTVGVIPVDLFGQCARLEEIEATAQRHGLWVVEDAAQSFGAERLGRRAGAFGQIGVTSFFPAKPLGCYGDGGMIFTDDADLAEKTLAIRTHGQKGRYQHLYLGLNARLDTLQAAFLLVKFSFFEEEMNSRQRAAEVYEAALSPLPGIETPVLLPGNTSVWAQYTLKAEDRDGLAAHLSAQQIPTAVHYPVPLHLQPAFKELGYEPGRLPASEKLSQRVLSLPMHAHLTEAEQGQVIEAVNAFALKE